MNTKLQELTEKIYQEGVEKGKSEAAIIIEKAEAEAAGIVLKAQKEAETILKAAQEKSAELTKNTGSELKLFARQTVDALKSEITGLIAGSVASESVKAASSDKAFMQKVILKLVEEMAKNQSVSIEAKDADALTEYFRANTKNLLNQGVKITKANDIKTDFTIVPDNGGYKLTFGDEELIAFFREFLRPKLVEMLF
jgi:V/A-type H+-transporting ATPase subunit E